ncbi:hypothetical protein NDU88_003738 [Pleurodeles waltl]|uniref:Uncharacterized protein n=1 Tax=Pleurodeles waltl TaxID=8319 RepID=A0AAV7TPI5_PLEWA|nr:hypothetical protein NDU88_003738 [Pleurodeles waltl]
MIGKRSRKGAVGGKGTGGNQSRGGTRRALGGSESQLRARNPATRSLPRTRPTTFASEQQATGALARPTARSQWREEEEQGTGRRWGKKVAKANNGPYRDSGSRRVCANTGAQLPLSRGAHSTKVVLWWRVADPYHAARARRAVPHEPEDEKLMCSSQTEITTYQTYLQMSYDHALQSTFYHQYGTEALV